MHTKGNFSGTTNSGIEYMKVLILSPALNAVSGVSTHVNMLLSSSLHKSHDVIHFQVGREGRIEGKLQRLLRFLFSPLQLAFLIIKHHPNIVHLNSSMDHKAFWRDLIYFIIARSFGCRVVNQFHSGSAPQNLFSNPFLLFILKRYLLASHIVTVLSYEALCSYKAFDKNIMVELVPNAIDVTDLLEVKREPFEFGKPLQLVYMGRIIRSKGLIDALFALKQLKDNGLKFILRVAGSGPDEALARTQVEALGLIKEVEFLGQVSGDAKNKLWLTSNIQVFPTFHNEGLPYSILESMAAGCVPVSCATGAIPDVMRDGVHGIFVPAQNPFAIAKAIQYLAENPDVLLRLSKAGRQRITESYTVDKLVERLDEIYKRLVS